MAYPRKEFKKILCTRCRQFVTVPHSYSFKTCQRCRVSKRGAYRDRQQAFTTEKRETSTSLEDSEDLGVYSVKIVSGACIRFRRSYLGLEQKTPQISNHNANCRFCQLWYSRNHRGFSGCNIWKS